MLTIVSAEIRTDSAHLIAARKATTCPQRVEWGPVQENGDAVRVRSACESKASGRRSCSRERNQLPEEDVYGQGALDPDMGGTAGYDPHRNMAFGKCGGL